MKQRQITALLVGNPNCGKTSLFNLLTGANGYVGNWAGVTTTVLQSSFTYGDASVKLVDLPGTYSLIPYSDDERVTADRLDNSDYDVIVNIVNALELKRSLLLTYSLMRYGRPIVIAVNMTDAAADEGIRISTDKLSEITGCRTVPVSAAKRIGVDKLKKEIAHVRKSTENDSGRHTDSPQEFGRLTDDDTRIRRLAAETAKKCTEGKRRKERGRSIDRFILSKWVSSLILAAVFSLTLFLSFGGGVSAASEAVADFFGDTLSNGLAAWLTDRGAAAMLVSLICDGVIDGVGSVLSFLPQLTVMFLCLSFIEDCGYMARAAMIADHIMVGSGLDGRGFASLAMGMGCTATAVMTTRSVPETSKRRRLIFMLPFVPCSAKIPILVMLSEAFFGGTVFLFPAAYLIGIATAFAVARILYLLDPPNRRRKESKRIFMLELPPYRLPMLRNLFVHTLGKIKDFLFKAATVLLIASVVIWALKSFGTDLMPTSSPENSILGKLGGLLAPIFAPLGFGSWQAVSALICGLISKESVLSAFGVILSWNGIETVLTPASAASFIVFVILSVPCVATLANIRRESRSLGFTALSVVTHLTVSWICSYFTFLLTSSLLR